MKLNIFIKFFIAVGSVIVLVGIASVFFTVRRQENLIKGLYYDHASSLALSLDAGVSDRDLEDPEVIKPTLLKFLLLNPEIVEISIFKKNDEGNFFRFVSTSSADEHLKTADNLNEAYEGNKAVFHLGRLGERDVLGLSAPVHVSGSVAGVYHIDISLLELQEFLDGEVRITVIMAILAIIGFVLGILLFVRLVISKPLSKLISATGQIESGDFDIQIINKSRDEIGELSQSFLKMAQKLKYSYSELGKRVEEKTKELSDTLKVSEDQNLKLELNKSAMINILEDEKELEDELKVEKASVEKKVVERTTQVHEEKAKLSASIENLPVGFMMVDLTGVPIVLNGLVARLLGGTNAQNTYTVLQGLLKGKVDIADYLKNCNHTSKPYVFDGISLKDGRILKILLSPILTPGEKENICIGIVVLVEDVTEAKVLERSRDEFFSIASHELRTPLTAIKGNTSLIEQYYGESIKDPELKNMIADIHESSSRLIDIVNDFLDISRLEQGKIEYCKTSIDLPKLIDDVLKEFQATGSQKKIAMEYKNIGTKIPLAFADIDKVKQVLINLIGNSLKFTENGSINLSAEVVPGFIKILVTDTGRGISPENQKLLFRKFQQAGSSLLTRDTTKGTGLGLYISKLIVNGMGGEIKLESSVEGKGSVFSFSLPIATTDQLKNGAKVNSSVKVDSKTGLTTPTT